MKEIEYKLLPVRITGLLKNSSKIDYDKYWFTYKGKKHDCLCQSIQYCSGTLEEAISAINPDEFQNIDIHYENN